MIGSTPRESGLKSSYMPMPKDHGTQPVIYSPTLVEFKRIDCKVDKFSLQFQFVFNETDIKGYLHDKPFAQGAMKVAFDVCLSAIFFASSANMPPAQCKWATTSCKAV